MSDSASLARRIRRLEDRESIAELIARYCLVMDNRDMENMPALFTPDVVIQSADGVMNTVGREAAVEMFRGRFLVLGPSNHFTHDRIITFDEGDDDRATGLVLAHAEMNRKNQPMLAAIRYDDVYQRHEGCWKFRSRTLAFMYYVPTAQYLDAFGPGIGQRNRAYDTAVAADWPEKLPTWRKYYGD